MLICDIEGSQRGFNNRLPEAWKAIRKSLIACNCAGPGCSCRRAVQQPLTAVTARSMAQVDIAEADINLMGVEIEHASLSQEGSIRGCCS